MRSLEIDRDGLGLMVRDENGHFRGYEPGVSLHDLLRVPNRDRLFAVYEALMRGDSPATVCQLTAYDPWFVTQMAEIVEMERSIRTLDAETVRRAKRMGFSDSQLARIVCEKQAVQDGAEPVTEQDVRALRSELGLLPTYHQVDTCAAEFEAYTPYLYSSYESADEAPPSDRRKIMILGGGPNRIGQGIEFDYCCCHASYACKSLAMRRSWSTATRRR